MSLTKYTSTVAICALYASGVYAQDQPVGDTVNETDALRSGETLSVEVTQSQILGSELLGATVYTTEGPDGEAVGDIEDLLVGQDGMIAGLVIGVGGFLGLAEKNVAVPFTQVEQYRDDQYMLHLTLAASREQLEGAPEFDYRAVTPTPELQTGISASSDMASERGDRSPDAETAPTTPMDRMAGEGSSRAPDVDGDMSESELSGSPASTIWRDAESVSNASLRAEELLGADVFGGNGDQVGDIGDVILKPEGGVQAFIVDVGGFLGIGEKEVAMSAENLDVRSNNGDFAVFTRFTVSQLEGQPEYDADAFNENPDEFMMR
ncbi:UNVERIFIED_ORG: PRC-barrel domain protein [Martelella mediterranea]